MTEIKVFAVALTPRLSGVSWGGSYLRFATGSGALKPSVLGPSARFISQLPR
jgi:hypothetical protein